MTVTEGSVNKKRINVSEHTVKNVYIEVQTSEIGKKKKGGGLLTKKLRDLWMKGTNKPKEHREP